MDDTRSLRWLETLAASVVIGIYVSLLVLGLVALILQSDAKETGPCDATDRAPALR